jgi:hypothetical protein
MTDSPQGLVERLRAIAQWLDGNVRIEQPPYDLPPEPISQFDYELGQTAYELKKIADAAEAALREAQKDAERLDWLIANAEGYAMHMGAVLYTPTLVKPRNMPDDNIRAAIDAARKVGTT